MFPAQIQIISVNKIFLRVTPSTTDTTSLNYNYRRVHKTINTIFKNTQSLNGTTTMNHQDIQTPSRFTNEENFETQ